MKLYPSRSLFWKGVLAILFIAGVYAALVRFGKGLEASTHLSDDFPWGIWIGFDVLVGVGLAAGGFVIAATVHIFNLKRYEPISRSTVLTAFLGYVMVSLALLFDVGRPYRIWHPLVLWNPHSVMFEVAWCVILYTGVLALELSPVVFERFRMAFALKIVRFLYIPLVIAGVLLSTLHQSSLGTLYVIVPDKLHGLWYSPLLPVFFFVSAIGGGLAMVIFESFISSWALGKRLERDVLTGLSRVIVVVLAVYLVLKGLDLYRRGALGLALEFDRMRVLFWAEIGMGVLLPMILLFVEAVRRSPTGLFLSAVLVIVGFVLNRLNVSITGMVNSELYFPKWTEIAVTMSVVALGFVIFGLAVKHFPIFPSSASAAPARGGRREGEMEVPPPKAVAILWGLLLVVVGAYAAAEETRGGDRPSPSNLQEATPWPTAREPLNLPADVTLPQNEGSPGSVTFRHAPHVAAGGRANCAPCHSGLYPLLAERRSPARSLSKEEMRRGESCGRCHNGRDAFPFDDDCTRCHALE